MPVAHPVPITLARLDNAVRDGTDAVVAMFAVTEARKLAAASGANGQTVEGYVACEAGEKLKVRMLTRENICRFYLI